MVIGNTPVYCKHGVYADPVRANAGGEFSKHLPLQLKTKGVSYVEKDFQALKMFLFQIFAGFVEQISVLKGLTLDFAKIPLFIIEIFTVSVRLLCHVMYALKFLSSFFFRKFFEIHSLKQEQGNLKKKTHSNISKVAVSGKRLDHSDFNRFVRENSCSAGTFFTTILFQ